MAPPLFTQGWLFQWLSGGVTAMVTAVHRPKILETRDLEELARVVTATPMAVHHP